MTKQMLDVIRKSITEKARLPGGVSKSLFLSAWYFAEISHGRPRPTKTFTEFEPVTLPIAESAVSEVLAAVILAKVSGSDVPTATSVIAVTASARPSVHPSTVATSATTAVMVPIKARATRKAGMPPQVSTGGMNAKSTFQPMQAKCINASLIDGWLTMRSYSSTCGQSITACLN